MGTTAREPMERGESEEEEEEELGEEVRPDQQRCRICAGEASAAAAAARIFGEEGRKRNLQRSIQKYLHIAVSSKDMLPKMVCASCIDKLDDIHAFATMAMRSQERLRQELLRATSDLAVTVDSSDSFDSSVNKLGDRGLLHSILTKGSIEPSNEEELLQRRQRTPSTEEMEVKVDPMLFLQCALEQSSSVDYSDFSDESDVEINSEPLSLTKKKIDNDEEYVPTADMRKNCDDNDNENVDNVTNCKSSMSDVEDEEFEEGEELSTAKQKAHLCKICAKAFASQIALQNHLWSHLPTTTSTMNVNDCTDKDLTEVHAQRFFDGANGVISQNNSCSETNLLNGHFICPICGKKISTKGNLKVHLETHRPKGKYGCDICGRIFKTQSNLFRHKEYHSGIQFPCVVCGRVYPTNSTLRAHSITHSDLRPHACPLCDKTFKRNQDLKFHINQHTGARPYQCPYCPKAFASSGNCFSHRKRMHPKEVHRDRQRAADLMR